MRFLSLANTVIAVFAVSLGPFALMGQLPQLLSRLFPFTRGLNHAYWAPNAWALVTAADRVLVKSEYSTFFIAYCWTLPPPVVAPRLGIDLAADAPGVISTSRGLVGDTVFAVLPNIKPIHTFTITIVFQLVRHMRQFEFIIRLISHQAFLGKLWLTPTYKSFVTALTLCGYTSYMFGWHVHEKAILLVLVPLRLVLSREQRPAYSCVVA
jgi:alpha-1,3-glucosyltransferase